jgi:hypothetical protein
MLGKITITCFAASYLVALLELSRLLFRSGIRGAVMLGFAAAGFVAHTLFLGYRWFTEREWLNSEFDWYLLAAWVLAGVYLYLVCYHRHNPIGLFILPVVLLLVLVAQFWANRAPFPKTSGLNGYVAAAHGTFQLLGTVAAAIGFMSGAMYLIQAWRLKHKKIAPQQGLRLPTLEWLQRTTSRAISTSGVMLIGGFLSGALLSRIKYGEVRWSDPVVWSSSVLAAWMVTAGAFNLVYKPARQGRKVAYLTLATFVLVALTLAAMLMDPHHGGKQAAPAEEPDQPQAVQAGGAA